MLAYLQLEDKLHILELERLTYPQDPTISRLQIPLM